MKKTLLLLVVLVIPVLPLFNETITTRSNSFFGVYGKQASVMGTANGSDLEIWIYPYKVLHDYQIRVISGGVLENPYLRIKSVTYTADCFQRLYTGERWQIKEQIFPALEKPYVFIVYKITANHDIELELSFKPDLSPMWPAAIGGKFSYWHTEGFFVLGEASGKNIALFGSGSGKKVGDLPAHKLPGGRIKQVIKLSRGEHTIPFVAVAGQKKLPFIKKDFIQGLKNFPAIFQHRQQALQNFRETHLNIKTPQSWINRSLDWAIINLHLAFVNNPQLGEGLIAGYGLSKATQRPGFAWYFGGDGLINSFALLDSADFAGARKELEFLFKYQRRDGKIMHELSQGAGFVRWFKDYGFAYFHGDTTLYFLTFLDSYVRRSGDLQILNKYEKKINKCLSWLLACDTDRDGIVDTPLAGTGASETGPLRQKMKTDILLASLSVKAWQGLANIYSFLQRKKQAGLARKKSKSAARRLEKLFWLEDKQYYAYAVRQDGSRIPEITIWPAIGMCLQAMDANRCKLSQRLIASPHLSADWGTRFLSSRSSHYNPVSYNNGAVWPFLSGFASWALYKSGNPFHAFTLLTSNLRLVYDFDMGAATELLSGDLYTPLEQSVPNQIWSSGNTISAFVKGLLGYSANAITKTIELKPFLPLHWPFLQVKNLRAGNGYLNLDIQRLPHKLRIRIYCRDLAGYKLRYIPDNSVMLRLAPPQNQSITRDKQWLQFDVALSGYLYPFVKRNLQAGDTCRGPIIEAFKLNSQQFQLVIWGRGKTDLYLFSDLSLEPSSGRIKEQAGLKILQLDLGKEWQRKRIYGKITEKSQLEKR